MSGPRVAIVGAGPMGRLHARTVLRAADPGADAEGGAGELVAIVDHHAARARQLADAHGVEARDDLAELAALGIEAAIVAVPTAVHVEVGLALLEQGVDLLVEKPLAPDLVLAQRLVDRASALGRILQVGHVEWYNPGWRAALAQAGRPRRIEVRRLQPWSERGLDLDVVQDLMLHDLDWVSRAVGGSIAAIEAEGARVRSAKLDRATARLRFESGCEAHLEVSRVDRVREREVRIEGVLGCARASLLVEAPSTNGTNDPLGSQWAAFVDAVATRRPPENDGRAGLAALALVERVRARIAAAEDAGASGVGGRDGDHPRLGR